MLKTHTLKNGIPVFVVETHSSPVVSVQAWIKRGSIHETADVAGISHFLEHSLFKGTKRRKVGQIADEIETHGGEINAYTSFAETVYYTTLASRFFDTGLDIISDAVQNPAFDKEEMLKEREVILEEIRRAQDSTFKMVSMRLWENLFAKTPYGRPVLGYESTVKKIDAKKLKSYFTKEYNAATMSIFIVGDVNAKEVFQKVEKKFGKLAKKKRDEKAIPVKTKAFSAPKVLVLEKDIQECQLQIGWHAPKITDSMIADLDLVCTAIGQGESSRLYQGLIKETKLALSASLGVMSTPECGMMALTLVTAPENIYDAVEEALRLLNDTISKGLNYSEIERVKTSLESDVVTAKETVDGYAQRLGHYYHSFGDPQYESRYLEQVLNVESEAALKALCQVLQSQPVLSMAHPKSVQIDVAKLEEILKSKPGKVAKSESAPAQISLMKSQGAKVILKSCNHIPIVSMRWIFAGGSREEKEGLLGQNSLFQRTWTAGANGKSSLQIAHTLESLGASCYAFSGKHTMGLSFECLRKHWPVLKGLLADILLKPEFHDSEVAIEKELIQREIMAEKDSPGALCQQNFAKLLYGNHPYGRSHLGTKESIARQSSATLKQFFKDYIHSGNLVLSTVGAVNEEFFHQEIEPIIKMLPKQGKSIQPKESWEAPQAIRIQTAEKHPLFQSHILVGFPASTLFEQDRYALKLLSSCLSGQGGRLFMELRDKQSLAYTVAPISSDSPERGMFGVYIGCAPDKVPAALSGIRTELKKVLDTPMSQRELDRAKQYWLGRYDLDMQRYLSQAMTYGLDEFYGLGADHGQKLTGILEPITAKQIQEVAQKYIALDKATLSIVHPTLLSEEKVAEMWGTRFSKGKAA